MTLGYIVNKSSISEQDLLTTMEVMNTLHCDRIYEDSTELHTERPHLKYILEEVKEGDTIVFHKLSNALANSVELNNLFRLCDSKNLRIASVHDRLDTEGVIFSKESFCIISLLSLFQSESFSAMHKQKRLEDVPESAQVIKNKRMKDERNIKAIDMYIAGYSYKRIMETLGIGSTRTLWKIIQSFGVSLDRKHYDRMFERDK